MVTKLRWGEVRRSATISAGVLVGAIAIVLVLIAPGFAAATAGTSSTAAVPAVLPTCASVGSFPSFPAYDPVTHDLYVPNQLSRNVSIVGPGCALVATVLLPPLSDPIAAAFDPQNNYVYVSDFNLNQVYVLHNTIKIATIAQGHFNNPSGITFDPGDGIMLVANFGWENISAISGVSYTGSIPVGIEPQDIAYDPFYNTLLVTNEGSSNVTIISSATFPFSASHSSAVAGGPIGIVFDPADNLDYIASFGTNNVTVMDGLGGVVTSIPVGSGPITIGFSQATLHVYVTMRGSNNVYVLNSLSVVKKVFLAKGATPIGVVYDDFDNQVYVAGSANNVLYVMH
jgi:DNA-binding beta-propeller fold protein YncE